jgi:recombinational DNA repair ATPase RecF
MKIKTLAIRSVRGIVDIELNFDGKNSVIYGINGTGKSAVVDAIDFLLTGQISRLMGSGTLGMSLSKHGKHVDATDLSACFVEGEILITGHASPVKIKRQLSNPSHLIVDQSFLPIIEPVLEIAKKHQFLLTRREILKFITADGGSRSNEIQKLLKLDEIGQTRRILVQLGNKLNSYKTAEERNLAELRTGLQTILGMSPATIEEALTEINKYRAILQAEALLDLDPEKFLLGLSEVDKNTVKKKPTQGEVEKIVDATKAQLNAVNLTSVEKQIHALCEALGQLNQLGAAVAVVDTVDLLNQGLRVIHSHEESEEPDKNCPLCLTEIDPHNLELSINQRLEKAKEVNEKYSLSRQNKQYLLGFFSRIKVALTTLSISLQEDQLKDIQAEIAKLVGGIEEVEEVLKKEIPLLLKETGVRSQLDIVMRSLSSIDFSDLSLKIKQFIPSGTSKEEAISILAKTQEKVSEISKKKTSVKEAKINHQRATELLNQFEIAQNEVIDNLYESIKERFVELYRDLHTVDEASFQADLQQEGASVNLSVDFYGRGQHPPHALHSEGHQDSMGVCLFLALNEKVSEGKIQTIVLDDVVTSVDTEHRRELCRMLKNRFPSIQFLITTHDTTWAQQMKSFGVVDKKNLIKFYGWAVDSGPKHAASQDIWEQISEALDVNDVHVASAKLRRYSEEFYLNMCLELLASVPCKLDGGWTLGDLFPSTWKKYCELLKEAQKAAKSWGDEQLVQDVETRISQGKQIYNRAWQEAWSINRTTHFTHWENLSKTDFVPVVEAFRDFADFFTCTNCKQISHVTVSQTSPFELESLTCECGNTSFNLRKNSGKVLVSI